MEDHLQCLLSSGGHSAQPPPHFVDAHDAGHAGGSTRSVHAPMRALPVALCGGRELWAPGFHRMGHWTWTGQLGRPQSRVRSLRPLSAAARPNGGSRGKFMSIGAQRASL